MADDQFESGFSYTGTAAVCPECIPSPELSRYVAHHGHPGNCDFCHRSDGVSLRLHDLFVFIGQCFRRENDPVSISANISTSGYGLDEVGISATDLLADEGEPLGDGELLDAFASAFVEDWVPIDAWIGPEHERLLASWQSFAAFVMNTSRFVFLDAERAAALPDPGEVEPARMLSTLGEVLQRAGVLVPLPAGQTVYRGRKHRPGESLVGVEDLGPPPSFDAGPQRMSPAGIPFFYGAANVETCLHELRGVDGEHATVACWVTAQNTYILDLVRLPEVPSIFASDEDANSRTSILFLRDFGTEISRPRRAYDRPEVDYVPTQVVADYVRHCVRAAFGAVIEGISYLSSNGGTNTAFFVGRERCGSEGEAAADALLLLTERIETFEATGTVTKWESVWD